MLVIAVLAWRLPGVLDGDVTPDPRERLIAREAQRLRAGEPLTLFHWPGTPWVALIAATTPDVSNERDVAKTGRRWTLAFQVFAILALLRLARRNGATDGAAAIALVASPAFVTGEAALALVDVPALALTLASSLAASEPRWNTPVRALVAGVLAGLGAAFKLPAVIAVAPALVLLNASNRRAALFLSAIALGGVAVGFIVGCPYILTSIVDPAAGVFADLRYELGHYRLGHFGIVATARDMPWTPVVRHASALAWAAGPLLVAFAVSMVGLALTQIRHWRRFDAALFVWLVCAAAPILLQRLSFGRHWLAVLPPLYLTASRAVVRLPRGWRGFAIACAAPAVLQAALASAAIESAIRQPSTIESVASWIRANPSQPLSAGPSLPVLNWVYPQSIVTGPLLADVGQADAFLVASIEESIHSAVSNDPDAYRESDFFPLERADFASEPFYRTLLAGSRYVEARRFAAKPPGWLERWGLLERPLPFPLNALAHPELRIYVRSAK